MHATPSSLLQAGRWNLQIRLQRFAGNAIPVDSLPLPFPADTVPRHAEFAGAQWDVTCRLQAVPERPDALDGVLVCQVMAGQAQEVNAKVELVVTEWSASQFLLLPAAAYNGNRYAVRHQQYPPIATEPGDLGPTPDCWPSSIMWTPWWWPGMLAESPCA